MAVDLLGLGDLGMEIASRDGMQHKTISIPDDCIGAVQAALKIRIVYLQSYREETIKVGYPRAAEAIMRDIANLTMISDRIQETPYPC